MQTGRKILNLRCDRKISQQDLARASDITPSALSKIEAGINSPRANVLWRIAQNLGVTVEYLLDEGIPYPYTGYSYRQDLLSSNEDPSATVRVEITREEQAFLEALRKGNRVARDIAMSIPEAPVETLRLVHFLLNHSKVQNPSRDFLNSFESLVTTGEVEAPAPPRKPARQAAAPAKRRAVSSSAKSRGKAARPAPKSRRRTPARKPSRQSGKR